jgi:hypothetical protein
MKWLVLGADAQNLVVVITILQRSKTPVCAVDAPSLVAVMNTRQGKMMISKTGNECARRAAKSGDPSAVGETRTLYTDSPT